MAKSYRQWHQKLSLMRQNALNHLPPNPLSQAAQQAAQAAQAAFGPLGRGLGPQIPNPAFNSALIAQSAALRASSFPFPPFQNYLNQVIVQ